MAAASRTRAPSAADGPLFSAPAWKGGSIDARFLTWIEANPHVLRRFVELALGLVAKGHTRLSSKMIVETIRCEAMLRTRGDVWKINNDFSSRLGRLAVSVEPRLTGHFEFRELPSRQPEDT